MKGRRWAPIAGMSTCGVVLSLWEGTLARQSESAHVSVGVGITVAVAGAAVVGRSRQGIRTSDWIRESVRAVAGWRSKPAASVVGVLVWVVLFTAIGGWDLNSFVHQAYDLPTLSRVIGAVTSHWWGRGLVFAAWLSVGTFIVAGHRRKVES